MSNIINLNNQMPNKRLITYHTTECNPVYYWENNEVAIKLKDGDINSYEEYKSACKLAGCVCYSELVYIEYTLYVKQLQAKYGDNVQRR